MHVVVLCEEPSMEALLRILLPRILPEISTHEIHAFRNKRALRRRVQGRLRGYARWVPEGWRIVVLVDRDRDDCLALKDELEAAARGAGLRTTSGREPWQVANRIVVEELEAWYFGDWQAVLRAFPRVSPTVPNRQGYRDPDGIVSPWEAFERILQRQGYFRGGLRKTEAARAIAEQMDPEQNRSKSFSVFYRTLMELGPAVRQVKPPRARSPHHV